MTEINEAKVQKRVKARELAIEFINDYAKENKFDSKDEELAYWRQIEILAVQLQGGPKREEGPTIQPMSENQAKGFEVTKIPFGIHIGEMVKDVSLRYLLRLADPSVFIRDLRRYILSARIQRELQALEAHEPEEDDEEKE